MREIPVQEALEAVDRFLRGTAATPFFVLADGNEAYRRILGELRQRLPVIAVSGFCAGDAFPDFDGVAARIRRAERASLVVGLGEAVRLSGASSILGELKDTYTDAKIVILCRGVRREILSLAGGDPKFGSRNYCVTESPDLFEVRRYDSALEVPAHASGFQELLQELERGEHPVIRVKSSLAMRGCRNITTAYGALREEDPGFPVPESCLEAEQWEQFLTDRGCSGYPVTHWRTFLKYTLEMPQDPYVRYVLERPADYADYSRRIVSAILEIPPEDGRFQALYQSRKELLREADGAGIAGYVSQTAARDEKRIYYLTDNTEEERREILKEIARRGSIPPEIERIYPALGCYLQNYSFSGENGPRLTDYFAQYKLQKVRNAITPEFLQEVLELARPGNRLYHFLPTRGSVLEQLESPQSLLYWIDGLGVEYLGYLQKRAKELGLVLSITVAKAELPTLTAVNRDFYDNWSGPKENTRRLDDGKHRRSLLTGTENRSPYPIHLSEELTLLDDILKWVRRKLSGGEVSRVILASDHGASRLAVINERENRWKMATSGEHSGRCCPVSEVDERPDCATEERGFWVLANYDRFQGGRKANVEVHGGASLEEVLVPVIAVSWKRRSVHVENLTPVTHSDNLDTIPTLVLHSAQRLERVTVYFRQKPYPAVRDADDPYRFQVQFPDFRRSGSYTADVYGDDNYTNQISFEIQRTSGGSRRDQEDFFS